VPGTASAFDKQHDSRQEALWQDGQADLSGLPVAILARAAAAL
jgi:hypothetical protein